MRRILLFEHNISHVRAFPLQAGLHNYSEAGVPLGWECESTTPKFYAEDVVNLLGLSVKFGIMTIACQ